MHLADSGYGRCRSRAALTLHDFCMVPAVDESLSSLSGLCPIGTKDKPLGYLCTLQKPARRFFSVLVTSGGP